MDVPIDIEFIKNYRKRVWEVIWEISKNETPAQKGRRTRLKKLEEEAAKLRAKVTAECSHPLEMLFYTERGREDDYGSYLPGGDDDLWCKGCNRLLVRWEERAGGEVTVKRNV